MVIYLWLVNIIKLVFKPIGYNFFRNFSQAATKIEGGTKKLDLGFPGLWGTVICGFLKELSNDTK